MGRSRDKAHESGGFFAAWADLATGRPRLMLALCVGLAIASGLYAASRLGFVSDRSGLVDQTLAWQRRYTDLKERFPRWNDAVVVVALASASASREVAKSDAREFFEALHQRISDDPLLPSASLLVETDGAPAGMVLLQSDDGVRRTVEELRRAMPALSAHSVADLLDLAALGAASGNGAHDPAMQQGVARLVSGIEGVIGGTSDSVLGVAHTAPEPLMVGESNLAVGFVSLGAGGTGTRAHSVNDTAPAVSALRAHVAQALEASGLSGRIEVGVTGVPVLEADETEQSIRDGSIAGAISAGLVATLLVIVYRGIVIPLLAMAAMQIGMAWSFGWCTMSVGHLQVLSVVFVAMLMGMGNEVAIHLIARLELEHPDHDHLASAVRKTYIVVGPGIMTSALTTASAFGATALTHFAGVAEMGIIAAGGIVLCMIAVLTCFPAMLMLLPRPERFLREHDGGISRPFAGRLGVAKDRRPVLVLSVSVVALLASVPLAWNVRYEPDLMALMPDRAESVRWERRVTGAEGRTAWHAIAIAPDESTARKWIDTLHAHPEVGSIGGVGDFLVDDAALASRAAILRTLPEIPPRASAPVPSDGARVRAALDRIARAQDGSFGPKAVASAARAVASLDAQGAGAESSLARVDRVFREDQGRLIARIDSMRSATAPALASLPAALRSLIETTDGGLIVRIYPAMKPGVSPLAEPGLGVFARGVLGVVPSATGPTIQIYESTRVILRAFQQATVLAIAGVVVLLLVDFRNVKDAACALVPVGAATVLLLAIMRLADVPLNFANTIVLPLMLGIGVDSGVHAVHRWKQQPHDAPAGLAGGTGRAITVTTATTIAGFVCMLVAEHRGIRSLGFVMSVGLFMVWAAAVFMLPPILRLRTRWAVARTENGVSKASDMAA